MRSRTTVARLVIMMPLVLISITAQAKAGLITSPSVNTTAEPGGLTLYTYTLSNLDTSTLPAVEFILTVSPDANLGAISGPNGWQITYQAGDSEIDVASPSDATDIQPGSQGIVSFTSVLPPVATDYLIIGFDSSTITIDTNQGAIAGPYTAVPEPRSLPLLALALVLVMAVRAGGFRMAGRIGKNSDRHQ